MQEEREIQCPYCWETFTILVDPSEGDSSFVYDCEVCCRPIDVRVTVSDDGEIAVTTKQDKSV
jgi:DNA-directed RNA polymerase subunit RPC12/RpoP